MQDSLLVICGTAATLGFVHTLIGPDHYLPFVMLGKANRWSSTKLAAIVAVCGVGHVLSSILLGLIGIGIGVALKRLELVESLRGEIASWALIAFGTVYAIWGIRQARKNRKHEHPHIHENGEAHAHAHTHAHSHAHIHTAGSRSYLWWLFIIFVLGPCEPLIPLLMFPAATASGWFGIGMVSLVFGAVTVATMTVIALLAHRGLTVISPKWAEQHMHALAGGTIAASGLAIKVFGL